MGTTDEGRNEGRESGIGEGIPSAPMVFSVV